MSIATLLIGIALGQAGPEAAGRVPSLSYLENPSVVYRDCIAAVARGLAAPSVTVLGRGPCRGARSVLWTTVRYHVAERWSALPANRAEARRISAQIDDSAAAIVRNYEARLQRWLAAGAG
jgi:hypothetical protein